MLVFSYIYNMETKIIDSHPSLRNYDVRFSKTIESVVTSFKIEGIKFSEEELRKIIQKVEAEIKR